MVISFRRKLNYYSYPLDKRGHKKANVKSRPYVDEKSFLFLAHLSRATTFRVSRREKKGNIACWVGSFVSFKFFVFWCLLHWYYSYENNMYERKWSFNVLRVILINMIHSFYMSVMKFLNLTFSKWRCKFNMIYQMNMIHASDLLIVFLSSDLLTQEVIFRVMIGTYFFVVLSFYFIFRQEIYHSNFSFPPPIYPLVVSHVVTQLD